jgi:hypothetical protein
VIPSETYASGQGTEIRIEALAGRSEISGLSLYEIAQPGTSNGGGQSHSVSPRLSFLCQNAPNPFRRLTTIRFSLARVGYANLAVFDVTGRRIRELLNGKFGPGPHSTTWDGSDNLGRREAQGVYFYRLESGNVHDVKKAILVN